MMDIEQARRVVIKVGSALIVDPQKGRLREEWLKSFVADVMAMVKAGQEVILVTSGAVALGRFALALGRKPKKLEEKQAAAACGQIALMQEYQQLFAEHRMSVGQVLLTIEDSENRRRYLNARNTLETLIKFGVIPIINENDTVATAELKFGDNDRLAARVAQMIGSDLLILLSDIDGLYTANPHEDKNAEFIPFVHEIDSHIEQMAGGVSSDVGSGGMATKIMAAKIAMGSGCHMVITEGKPLNPIEKLRTKTQRSTWFVPTATPVSARKHWIATSLSPAGSVVVNPCAVDALKQGRSLLPIGVVEVKGDFARGDTVSVEDENGKLLARGIVAYSVRDAARIIGKHSREIAALLGFKGREELIHRDDLVVF